MAAHSLGKILNRGLEKIIEGICNLQWLACVSIAIDFISYIYIVPESWQEWSEGMVRESLIFFLKAESLLKYQLIMTCT